MTDDPTMKPCPRSTFDPHGHDPDPIIPCATCHGTGRVPLTTGEMLDALFEIAQKATTDEVPGGFELYGEDCTTPGFRWSVEIWHDGRFANFHGKTPDDALRAALRAVT